MSCYREEAVFLWRSTALHVFVLVTWHTVHAEGALGVIVFLPRNTDLAQLSAALPGEACCEVERIVLNGFLKAITVYIGALANIPLNFLQSL